MTNNADYINVSRRVPLGFAAGFLATLVFHQLSLWVLWQIGLAPFAPFPMGPTSPFGVPALVSLAFWGGVWGILYAYIQNRFPSGRGYWIFAFLFGAVFPTAVALLVVLPLKGRPLAGGWAPSLLATAFLINGAWGVGAGLLYRVFAGRGRRRERP